MGTPKRSKTQTFQIFYRAIKAFDEHTDWVTQVHTSAWGWGAEGRGRATANVQWRIMSSLRAMISHNRQLLHSLFVPCGACE